jgi:hypothetical protein
MTTADHVRSAPAATALLIGLCLIGPTGSAQNGAGVTVVDGRSWALETSGEAAPWTEAEEHCETLEAGGHDDWRLPTLFELESLFDASTGGELPGGIELEDCCTWSSTNLVALEPEAKGVLPNPAMGPDQYYWGLLFPDGIRYYSMSRFPDGLALCTRGD